MRYHLARILAAPSIACAQSLSNLLAFVVEETLSGRGPLLKEARIGLEVFGRRVDSYDPAIDPIVRVQMGRLRSKLRSYYSGAGTSDEVRIEIPLGGYVPMFTACPTAESSPGPRVDLEAQPRELRIAVLPIVNTSPDPDNQYFCDGLTEELIAHLAQIPELRVVARTSISQFKDAARDIREVGRLLDVSKVVEGSVRKAGNRIRVTVQLINVSDGCHLWSERYEGELTDIFAIHERIASAVQQSLQLKVLSTAPAGRRTRPRSIEAYNHYLQGRFQWNKRTDEGLRAALAHFEHAVTLDPLLARAFSGIADCHFMAGMSGAEAPGQCMPRAARAAATALRLDRDLSEAHASLAAVRNCYHWDLEAAGQGYHRAMQLDPGYATTRHWLGLFYHAAASAFVPALNCLEQATELDPLSPPIIADTGLVHAFGGNAAPAAMFCRRALELDGGFHRPYWFLGLARAWSGDFAAAEEALKQGLERCPGMAFRSRLLGALGFTYGRWGQRERAMETRRALEARRETSYVPGFELAQVEVGMGNHAGALACLEHGVADRDAYAIFLKSWRSFECLSREPRFRALLAQTGVA